MLPAPILHGSRQLPPGRRAVHAVRRSFALLAGVATLAVAGGTANAAQPPVNFGVASSFSALAGSTVTNTGPSVLQGDLGLAPGTSVTGFPPGSFGGTLHVADAVADQAQADLTQAYTDAAGRIPPAEVTGDLGGLLLTPGVYRAPSSIGLTGTLTLDAQGDPNAVFIFQVGSALTTATASRVVLINGAQPCNVTWQIGSSATLGSASEFVGNLMAGASISLDDAVTVRGRLLARTGAVTLINDTVVNDPCTTPGSPGGPPASPPPGGGGGGSTPAGGTPAGGTPTAGPPPSSQTPARGTATLTTSPRSVARRISRFGTSRCVYTDFRAVVTGRSIRRVVFSRDGRTIATRNRAPYSTMVRAGAGVHRVRARVTFTNGAPPRTLTLRFRICEPARASVKPRNPSRPPRRPGGFAG